MTLAQALAHLGLGAAFAVAVLFGLWLLQLRTRNATVVDVAWAANLGALAVWYAVAGSGLPQRRLLMATAVLAATWRLALHLWLDRARTGVEDGRYAVLRERWGRSAPLKFLYVYLIQALLDAMLSLPFLLAAGSTAPLGLFDGLACALWGAGWLGERAADRQLARFKADPLNRGRTCRAGLWRFSRHPNYFFQWLLWCSYALFAASAPWGWLAWSAPLAMLVLILFVSGIPPTEAQALRSRGDDYRAYQRETSAFVPWFPRSQALR